MTPLYSWCKIPAMVVLISQLWILGIEIEATIAEDEDSWLMNT